MSNLPRSDADVPATTLIAEFCDRLVAHDLPDLPAERRADVVAFAGRRIDGLPSPMRLGVGVVAAIVGDRRRGSSGCDESPAPSPDTRCPSSASTSASSARSPTPTSGTRGPTRAVHVGERRDSDSSAEVLVVGSGAGGAPTAALLAEAGFDVLVVEEGPHVRQGEVVPFSLAQMDRQYRSGGVTAALGFPTIAYTEGCCVGGGTEVNSGLYRRPPEDVLARWRTEHAVADFDSDELDAICDEVEHELSVQRVPGDDTPASEALRRGAAGLGWRHDEIPRWMTYAGGTSATAGRRQSMTETYLPRADRRRRPPATGHRVDRLVLDGGRATRALATDADGRPATIDARHVFVCGGAIQTPALLQRSGLRRHIGSTLAVHPTVKLAARFPDPINVPDDVPVHQVKEFAPDLSFGGSASGPGLAALALSDSWDRFGPAIEDWRRLSVYYAAITSEGRGSVHAVPRPARPARHVPPDAPRPRPARPRARPAGAGDARGRGDRGLPVVPRRPDRAPPRRPGDDAGTLLDRPGQRDDRAPVLDGAVRRGTSLGRRQLRARPRHDQRPRQRRLAAARRPRRQPAGLGDGHRHPQRPPLRRDDQAGRLMPTRPAGHDDRHRRRRLARPRPARPPPATGRTVRPARPRPGARAHRRRGRRLGRLPGVDPVVGDVRRPDGLAALFAGLGGTVDVIHTAGVIHPARVDDFAEINARGTANVVRAAADGRCPPGRPRVVEQPVRHQPPPHRHVPQRRAVRPVLRLRRSKMQAELRVLDAVAAGLDAVIVRPPWFYGPFQPARQTTFFRLVRTGRFPVIGDGRQRRSMVYVDNLVQGIVRAELSDAAPGAAWWIADARPYEVNEIVDTVGRALRAEGFDVARTGSACPPSPAVSPSAPTP